MVNWIVCAVGNFDGEMVDPSPCATLQEAITMRDAMRQKKVRGVKAYRLVWFEKVQN